MKSIKNIIAASLCTAVLFGSCTTNFDEYNTNPNQAMLWEITPTSLLEEILNSGASSMLDRTKLLNGELIQYTVSGTGLNSYHRYAINNAVQSGSWDGCYVWATDADHMYKLAMKYDPNDEKPAYNNCKAIALTMKALYISNATDIYGDVPLSNAFEGREGNTKPKFDTQKEVYTQIFRDLERANALYDVKVPIMNPQKDLMYAGDLAKWKKFTNSLYLRLLMRLSNRNTEMNIATKITEIVSSPLVYPLMTGNADNAALFYTGLKPFANRFGDDVWGSTVDRKAASNIIDLMVSVNDPRLPRYFVQRGSEWKGLPSGEYLEDGDSDNVAYIKKESLGTLTTPYAFMKYDEVMFILAEAAKLNMIPGGDATAKTYYDQALTASVEWWYKVDAAITPAEMAAMATTIADFVDNTAVYDNSLSKIYNMKYVSMFWVGYEAWHDYRRTGYPRLRIGSATEQNKFTLPTRFAYPINTAKTNPDNYNIAVDRLKKQYDGGDNCVTPVWWSKKASGN